MGFVLIAAVFVGAMLVGTVGTWRGMRKARKAVELRQTDPRVADKLRRWWSLSAEQRAAAMEAQRRGEAITDPETARAAFDDASVHPASYLVRPMRVGTFLVAILFIVIGVVWQVVASLVMGVVFLVALTGMELWFRRRFALIERSREATRALHG